MRASGTTVVKCIWVSAGLCLLALGLGISLVDSGEYATDILLPIILLLSFPAGPLVLLFAAAVIDPGPVYPALDYSLLWVVAFAAGYFQWFWVLPKLFGKCELTTLGLTRLPAIPVIDNLPSQIAAPARSKRPPNKSRRIVHFDGHGRTPLERVIADHRRRRTG